MSNKKSKKIVLYSTILSMLKEAKGLRKIRQKLGLSKQGLNYHLKTLEAKGYINNISYGVYEVKKEYKVKNTLQGGEGSFINCYGLKENDIRGHAFIVTLRLPKIPNWNNRADYMAKQDIRFNNMKCPGGGQSLRIGSSTIHIKSKSIILYENDSFLEEVPIKSKAKFAEFCIKVFGKLESMLGVSLKYKKRYWFKFSREHYSLIKNTWAKQANKDKEKIAVYDEYGQWFSIDNSFNLDEAEVMSTKENKAVEVATNFQRYMNDAKGHNFSVTHSFVLESFKQTNEQIKGLILAQNMYAENARSHVAVIRELKETIVELREEIRRVK